MLDPNMAKSRRLPVELRSLPSVRAEILYRVAPGKASPSLEGPVFDRHGNFYCCLTAPNDTYVKKITPEGIVTDFFHVDNGMVVGLCFHKDGRCFASNLSAGRIHILDERGQELDRIETVFEGQRLRPDCMVFRQGDLYFTDLRGTIRDPVGGVYRLTAESGFHHMERYLEALAGPDGITFAPDGRSLWIAECSSNSLLRFLLSPQGKPVLAQHSPLQTYRNGGAANVDTHAMDINGCIYLGIMMGGRAVILDTDGIPLANVLAPGFEERKLRYTPNLALRPDACEGYLLASDEEQAVVLRFPTLAPGQVLYAYE